MDKIEINIEKWCDGGYAIGYYNSIVCFVRNGIPGERVVASIDKLNKKHIFATAVNIISPSPDRIKPDCVSFPDCGGCDYRHISYEDELILKKNLVNSSLKMTSCLEFDIVRSIMPNNYRNRAHFHLNNGNLSFYSKNSNKPVEIKECCILSKELNQKMTQLSKVDKDDLWLFNEDFDEKGYIYKEMIVLDKNLKFRLDKESFFQVNDSIADKWLQYIVSIVENIGAERICDLYCGVGVIGIAISRLDCVRYIQGIEAGHKAVKNAKYNAVTNGVSDKTQFISRQVENCFNSIKDVDLIVLNPPREGLKKGVTDNLLKMSVRDIIYSSCDYHTLMRDIKELGRNYRLVNGLVFDMFPRTAHVETVVHLTLNGLKRSLFS